MTWTMDQDGTMLTAEEARAWLRKVVVDRHLAGQYWDQLVRLDRGLDLPVPLRWVVCLAQRDGIMAEPEIWESLNDALRLQMVLLDDGELRQVVNMIIDSAIESYAKPDDDDGGDWSLWDRGLGRPLTKDEAVQRIVGHVIAGDRPDLLDRLADWFDDFKTMLAAYPLESQPATTELLRSVVKDVVNQGYSETMARGGDWEKTELRGDLS